MWFCPPNIVPILQVEELRRDLRIKSQELEVKNAAANDKLKKMVKDQQEAEKKKVPTCFPGPGPTGRGSSPGWASEIDGLGQGAGGARTVVHDASASLPVGDEPGNPGAAAQAAGGHRRQTDERQRGSRQGGACCHRGSER